MSWLRAMAIVGVLGAATATAHAEDPWSVGVTQAQKDAAQKLLEEGNARFVEKDYANALEKYKGAVASWDHPAIRFNIVRCLIQLDRAIEASDELEKALKYGAKPLDEAVYAEALNYQKLLVSQIGTLTIKCSQPDVKMLFDGKPIEKCPYDGKRRIEPGAHTLIGQRDGYLTKTVDVIVIGGKVVSKSLELDPLTKAAKIVHRYPTWLPWTVFGAGAVVAGVGGLLDASAIGQMDRYDQAIASQCADKGCPAGQSIADKNAALRLNKIAIGTIAVGGAAALTGVVMLYLNRGKTVYGESHETAAPATQMTVLPTDGGAMATMLGSF